ncbi:MAG: biotin transporter BioY [Clostridiales bacterium]|nr:biotin transporter BioY [Clostridiales bacterium]
MENEKGEKVKKHRVKTQDIVYIGIFAALTAVCSWISIPLTVPITLQTMGVCITAGLLGTKRGTLAVLVYILLGIVGIPVFSGFKAGAGVLLGSTGGYIIGFIFTALIVGLFTGLFGNKIWVLALSMVLGIAVCYLFGTVWFLVVYNNNNADPMSVSAVLATCVTPFIGFDIIKVIISVIVCSKLKKYIK